MFRPFKKLNNESGIVLFIVLMTAIIIMIFSVSILTQSMNEINYAQQQIDQIATDQTVKGMFWNAYSSSGGVSVGIQTVPPSTVVQERNYVMAPVQGAAVPGGNSYTFTSTYDSFDTNN